MYLPLLCWRKQVTIYLTQGLAWQADREDAACAGHVPNRKAPEIRFDALTGHGKPRSQKGPAVYVGLELDEHFCDSVRRQAAAVVFNVDQDMLPKSGSGQRHRRVFSGELDSVFQ